MVNKTRIIFLMALMFVVSACSESTETTNNPSINSIHAEQNMTMARWYNQQQVKSGSMIFQKYCAECHMTDASGSPNWRQKDANGKYPPPPLNGSAHAWHHPLESLRRTVRIGGIPLGGSMPAFSDKLNAAEIDEVLAWVQSNWSDEIYAAWHTRNK